MMSFTRPYRIVVIDDDDEVLNLIKTYLADISHNDITLSLFKYSADALEFMAHHQVHIVITDLHLEFSNGADIITKCLALEKGIQVIALSADDGLMPALDCFNRGANSILLKPIKKKHLIKAISSAIEFLNSWHEILSNRMSDKE